MCNVSRKTVRLLNRCVVLLMWFFYLLFLYSVWSKTFRHLCSRCQTRHMMNSKRGLFQNLRCVNLSASDTRFTSTCWILICQGCCTDAHCALWAAQRLQLWLWGWEAEDPRRTVWPIQCKGVCEGKKELLLIRTHCVSLICVFFFLMCRFLLLMSLIPPGPVWKHNVGGQPRGDDQRGNVWHRYTTGDCLYLLIFFLEAEAYNAS